jgi:hypothetical protein
MTEGAKHTAAGSRGAAARRPVAKPARDLGRQRTAPCPEGRFSSRETLCGLCAGGAGRGQRVSRGWSSAWERADVPACAVRSSAGVTSRRVCEPPAGAVGRRVRAGAA